ncbi:MAG TPA: hypothetical protein VH044_02080, partial [Polyangiaceae bacterium]|nr:hypothetical protein [Polyangiaceae bacterium]
AAGGGDGGAPPGARANDLPVLTERSGAHTPLGNSGVTVTGAGPKPMPRWPRLLLAVAISVASVVALGRLVHGVPPFPATAVVVAPVPASTVADTPVPSAANPGQTAVAFAGPPAAVAASTDVPAPAPSSTSSARPHQASAPPPPARAPLAPRKHINIRVIDDSPQ